MLIQCTLNYIIIVHYKKSRVAIWPGTITIDFRMSCLKTKKHRHLVDSIVLFQPGCRGGISKEIDAQRMPDMQSILASGIREVKELDGDEGDRDEGDGRSLRRRTL